MAEKDVFSKLPKTIQKGAGIQDIDSDMQYVEDMLTTSLPPHRRAGVVDEMRKNYLLMKFKTLDLRKRLQKRKKTQLSLKERRELGMYKIYRKGMKYKDFQDLHCLWKEYISNYLDLKELRKRGFTGSPDSSCWPQFSHQISKADFHGAHVKIIRAQCSSLVGQTGIVIFDSKNTFKIIGRDDIVRTIPKQPSVFSISVEDFTFTLFGKYFCAKPPERSVKKIRNYIMADL